MSKKQLSELNAKIQLESKVHQEEIKQRKEVVGKIKRQITWLVGENIKQKKFLEVQNRIIQLWTVILLVLHRQQKINTRCCRAISKNWRRCSRRKKRRI